MFINHPLERGERRIIDAECFAHLMGLTDDHKVALAGRRCTQIHDNDHGTLTHELLLMLVPQCNQDVLQHLLNNADTGHSVGGGMSKEENVPVPVDVRASRDQAAEEYELLRQYLASNDHSDIYCHFR